jgi:hypothetical protein
MPTRVGPRGLISAYQIQIVQESAGVTVTLDTNSTALTIDKGVQLSGKTTARITGDTTGVVLNGKIKIQNKAGGLLGANTTSLLVPGSLKLSGKSTGTIGHNTTGRMTLSHGLTVGTNGSIYENSTGVYLKWKSTAKYITRNTTAN